MLLLWSTDAAWAHAILRETLPADGAGLDEVALRFNELVAPIAVQVLGADGRAAPGTGAMAARDDNVRLAHHLTAGTYVVSYRVTSADGYPAAGSITFGIGVAPMVESSAPESDASADAALAAVIVRAVHYTALLAGVGDGTS